MFDKEILFIRFGKINYCKKVFEPFGFHLFFVILICYKNYSLDEKLYTVPGAKRALKMWVGPLLILVTNSTATGQNNIKSKLIK